MANFDKLDSEGNGTLSQDEFNDAANLGRQGRPTFAQLDVNKDGFLSKNEVHGRLLTHFDQVDSDASGTLSADEFNTSVNLSRRDHKRDRDYRPTFEQLDLNSDGLLAKDEVRGRLLTHFDSVDSDASGTLSADEFNTSVNFGRQGHKGDRPTFEQLDLNSDGFLAKDEVRGRLLTHFNKVDSDASGTLSADEFNAHVGMGKDGYKATFEQLDSNSDGTLSAEEFKGAVNNIPKMAK